MDKIHSLAAWVPSLDLIGGIWGATSQLMAE